MKETVTPELRDAILNLAARPDIHSISCTLVDFRLWQGLFKEQVSRSERLDLPPQEALCLVGPDSGIPGLTAVFTGLEDDDYLPTVLPDQQGNFAPDVGGAKYIFHTRVSAAAIYSFRRNGCACIRMPSQS